MGEITARPCCDRKLHRFLSTEVDYRECVMAIKIVNMIMGEEINVSGRTFVYAPDEHLWIVRHVLVAVILEHQGNGCAGI